MWGKDFSPLTLNRITCIERKLIPVRQKPLDQNSQLAVISCNVALQSSHIIIMSPWRGPQCLCLLNVQVITIEEVLEGRATDIDARVVRAGPEDEQAEETDGEPTLQGAAVKDEFRVQQLVAMVISQSSGVR